MNNTKDRSGSQLKEIKPNKSLIGIKDTNKIVLTLILLTAGLLISLFGNLALITNNSKLAARDKIFVEQEDGTTQTAVEKDALFRSDEVIKETIINWLYLTWEWDSRIGENDRRDRGITIEKRGVKYVVPTRVYTASYLIEDSFRYEFLKAISKIIPKEVYDGRLTSNLIIYHIGDPIRNKDKYEVEVIATRFDISETGGGEKKQAKFNKILELRAIEPYKNVLGDEEPSAFRRHLNELLKNGLIVSSIRNREG